MNTKNTVFNTHLGDLRCTRPVWGKCARFCSSPVVPRQNVPRDSATHRRWWQAQSSGSADFFNEGSANEKGPEVAGEASKRDSVDPEDDSVKPAKEPMSDLQWWCGLIVYAVTNVGFYKLFELCSAETDIVKVLTYMAVYYSVCLIIRVIMRKLLGLKDFPQFFWEGVPKRH